jgi:hypothetical protein
LTRSPRRTHPLAALFAVGVLALVALAGLSAAAPAPASAGPYVNPSPADIRAELSAAAVARGIPPRILYGIAYQESTWRQFDTGGDPLISADNGIGIMQVTTVPAGVDVARLKTDIDYNIGVGADILVTKWGYAPSVFAVIGDGNPRCYEDWFFAVWAYNGLKADNPYPYRIWDHVKDGRGLWTGLALTPVPSAWLVDGLPPKTGPIATPQPEHWWSPTPFPKPVLSAPRAQKRVAVGARFTVSGTLSPKHLAGAHSVELRLSHWNGSSWVLRRTVLTTNRDSGDVTRWAAAFALGKTSRWKIVAAAIADADHAAATSTPAYVTVLGLARLR